MRRIIEKHKLHWSKKSFTWSTALGFTLLALSLFVNYFANIYTTSRASNAVTDIILDNIPVYNVNFIFLDGFAIFWAFVIFLMVLYPQKMPFTVKSIAAFILIRSIFISLTHLGIPPNHSFLEQSDALHYTTSGNDMFFSSHTGLPFLMSLVFWNNKKLRYIFIGVSLFFGVSVLLGHLHYSIDVFAAFFITYGIFHISRELFRKDYELAEEV
ncbi:MAG: phosphatase PAP2-related protein [Parcubacteria group bacterium]|jgi:hypothetical protein